MKIAVPLFGERVSPNFGASSKLLVVETRGETIVHQAIWNIGQQGAMQIARRLTSAGVETLICGGIQRVHKEWLTFKGVHVVDNQTGTVEELLENVMRSEAFHREKIPSQGGNAKWKCKPHKSLLC